MCEYIRSIYIYIVDGIRPKRYVISFLPSAEAGGDLCFLMSLRTYYRSKESAVGEETVLDTYVFPPRLEIVGMLRLH